MNRAKLGFVILGILFVAAVVLAATSDASGLPTFTSPLPPGNGNYDWVGLLEWIVENWELVSNIILIVLTLILSWLGRKQVAEKYGVELMREAEELARKHVLESGSERMEHVVFMLVEKLPVDVKAVLKLAARLKGMTFEKLVADLAQRWFDKVAGSS